jgi:fido (protein-threonine AMPylation protein)
VARTTFGRYDLSARQAVHRYLFADIYEWAGELRSVELAEGASMFARARHLRQAAERVFRQVARDDQLPGLDPPRFARAAGRLLADLNALHPFREGNGRAQRALLQLLPLRRVSASLGRRRSGRQHRRVRGSDG